MPGLCNCRCACTGLGNPRGAGAPAKSLDGGHGALTTQSPVCDNEPDAHARTGPRGAGAGDRSRAAAVDRRAGDGALDRVRRRRAGRRDDLADHAPAARSAATSRPPSPARSRPWTASPTSRSLRRALRLREGRAAEALGPRQPARGGDGPGRQRDLRGLGQGRRGQVHAHHQPGRGAGRRGPPGRSAGRRRVGLLDPAHAGPGRRAPARSRAERKILPARGPRHRSDVDRLLPRRGRRRGVARADAAQGARSSSWRTSTGASSTT